jgi:hypothetical protein
MEQRSKQNLHTAYCKKAVRQPAVYDVEVFCPVSEQHGSLLTIGLMIFRVIRGCIQKFPDWPPGARTANGMALCHWVQLYRYFVSQSNEFCRHNHSCCFSTRIYCCCLFRYRLSPEIFGDTFVLTYRRVPAILQGEYLPCVTYRIWTIVMPL